MAFDFSGIFANGDAAVMDEFQREFFGVGRTITSPFVGFGVAQIGRAVELLYENPDAVEMAQQIVEFSRRHPRVTFVYVYAECASGNCEYAGFACRDGERVHDEPFRDVAGDREVLRRLVLQLGIDIGRSAVFEPLSREYFPAPRRRVSTNPAADARRDNQPMQRTGAAGIVSLVRRMLGRGPGR
jgi:hypothetical protein